MRRKPSRPDAPGSHTSAAGAFLLKFLTFRLDFCNLMCYDVGYAGTSSYTNLFAGVLHGTLATNVRCSLYLFRAFFIGDNMSREISLTQGRVAVLDDCDYEYLSRWKWYAMKNKNAFYAVRNVLATTGRTLVLMHREILKPPDGVPCDHIDGDGLNNQRANLRICTNTQNAYNQRPLAGYTSCFKGVHRTGDRRKWQALIRNAGKRIYLGRFANERDAARAYDRATHALHGEFARLNFPEERATP